MRLRAVLSNFSGVCLCAALSVFLLAGAVMAEPQVISSQEAVAAQSRGELLIVDIRTPREWAEDGIASGAVPLDMRDRGFVQDLQALMQENPGTPVAFICATGVRSNFVATRLEELGLPGFLDISEGMHGSAVGPGWLAQGLPVEPYDRGSLLDRLRGE